MRPSQKQITPEQLAFAQVHALVRIVDDEADLREALSFVLDMEGWKTVTYGRAEDFFTGDSPSEPGCVVLDVRMPGMSGIEAQHEMRCAPDHFSHRSRRRRYGGGGGAGRRI